MHPAPVLSRSARPPDLVVSYGARPDTVADVRLPLAAIQDSGQPAPLVLFLHGGFWRAAYDRVHTGPLAEALAGSGFAVCAPEYRRVGQPGGGWPGTFEDVATAVSVLPGLVAAATEGRCDPDRLVLAGHSAGGHLALWAATGPLTDNRGAKAGGVPVVSLAGVCDLAACYREGLGSGAAAELMGGGPAAFPDRYAAADPLLLIQPGGKVALVHGRDDDRVPWQQSRDYAEKLQAMGGHASCMLIADCGHFEVIDPLSAAWPAVLTAFRAAAAGLGQS